LSVNPIHGGPLPGSSNKVTIGVFRRVRERDACSFSYFFGNVQSSLLFNGASIVASKDDGTINSVEGNAGSIGGKGSKAASHIVFLDYIKL